MLTFALLTRLLIPAWTYAANRGNSHGNQATPSQQLAPLLEPCLDAILAPLEKDPKMPRVSVEMLRSSFGAGLVAASTPAKRETYQNAMAVCDEMTNGMDQRAVAKAAAIASAGAPTLSMGSGIIKSSPLRGVDAGANAREIRKKQRDERNYADKNARTQSGFTESSAYKQWTVNSANLRKKVMALYTRQIELEALDAKNSPPIENVAAQPNPEAPAKVTATNSKPSAPQSGSTPNSNSGAGMRQVPGVPGTFVLYPRQFVIGNDYSIVKVSVRKGERVMGKWTFDKQGLFEATFEDKTSVTGRFSDDGQTFTKDSGQQFHRKQP